MKPLVENNNNGNDVKWSDEDAWEGEVTEEEVFVAREEID